MRSQKLILEDERQEDFDGLAAGWRAEYGDEGQAAESLLERVILNDWFLRRAERRHIEAEADLGAVHPLEWTEEQHHQIELYLRYKTSAERSFYRALSALRGLRKDKIREELDFEKMRQRVDTMMRAAFENAASEAAVKTEAKQAERVEAASRAKEVFGGAATANGTQRAANALCATARRGGRDASKNKKLVVLDQWVEVQIEDGKTVTRLYPSNEDLIKKGQAMEQVPDLVYRRLNFPQGIPAEYRWTANPDAQQVELGGMGTQRMTVDTWLDVIEREAASGTGHVGQTSVGNLPRPKERGECECAICTRNREVLERRMGG